MKQRLNQAAPLFQKYDSPISVAVRMAQFALESQAGQSELFKKSNNGFGIKASAPWTGERVLHNSMEVGGAQDSYFRKYPSLEASIKDHASFFTSTPFRASDAVYGLAIKANNYKDEAKNLGPKFPGDKSSYAGDPNYAQKLIDIVERYNLTQYDKEATPVTETKRRDFEQVMKQVYGTEVINWDGFKGRGAGRRSGNPQGAIIHNDYGRANGRGYITWLTSARIPNPALGYAHYYIDRKYAMRAVPTYQGAWHAGDAARGNFTGHGKPANYGNMQLIGYEVNESLSTTWEQFRLNEEVVFLQVAEDFLFYGLKPSRETIWLHNEFSSTSCPHRSWEIHVGKGHAYNRSNRMKLKDYFISRVQFWMDVLNRVREVPGKNYLPERGGIEEAPLDANPQGLPAEPQAPYTPPAVPWDKHAIGDTVTLANDFRWLDTNTYKLLKSKRHDELKGTTDKIIEVMEIPADKRGNNSQIAYRLEVYNSWILEEFLVESMDSWELVEDDDDHVDTIPPEPSYDGNYVYWGGKRYRIGDEIK